MATLRLRLTRSRSKLIVWVQDIYTLGLSETGEGSGLVGRLTRWVEAWTLRAADSVVVIHSRFADYVVDEFGVEPKHVTVIRNWSHLPTMETVDAADARKALGWPADVTLAVHTGNMGVKQGLENVVDAARLADERHASVHFILVGDGGERKKLQNYAEGVSRLTFQAPLSNSAYHLALSAADVFLVNEKPGVSAMAVPSKLTSYFHAGRPIVAATDPNGIAASEITESRSGVVVPAGDPSALLNAVLEMDSTAGRTVLYGRNGQEYRNKVLGEGVAINCWLRLLESLTPRR
ncbi:D-inositol-3-phosphate glycosyltransferase [Mycolicibacterium chubuense]|uniref:D-inositol-3-phosphate glycosyltransferase n=2 Tax=Mycolicibacterium chubuense TaxID=1800 RepID=A0A0J6WQL0_MYCCU|nr:D-inositol-3-phosphate glycosyltransferase [Mycolicibacterium chubuense]SPY00407.1 group 1 glycosyl transferase [Mycolicibacterium chubuense]